MFIKLFQQQRIAEEERRKEDKDMIAKQKHEESEFFQKVIESLQTTKVNKEELQVLMENNRREADERIESIE